MELPERFHRIYIREKVDASLQRSKPHACDISIHLVFVISLVLCVAFLSGIWPNYAMKSNQTIRTVCAVAVEELERTPHEL